MKKHFGRIIKADTLINIFLILATVIIGVYFLSENLIDYVTISQNVSEFRIVLQAFSVVSILILATWLSVNLEGVFLKKLIASYFIYFLISYFLLITQNLNNKNFDFFAFNSNNFFEIRSFGLIIVIILVSIILKYMATKIELIEKYYIYINHKKSSKILLSSLVAVIVFQDSNLVGKLKQFLSLSDYSNYQQLYLQIVYFLLTSILIVILVTTLFWQSIDSVKNNQSSLSLAIISSLFFAVVFNFLIQFGIRMNEDFYGEYIFLGATAFQLILLSLLNLTTYLLFNRYWQSTFFIIFLGTTITIANGLKYSMRREPLLLTDFSMVAQLDLIFNYIDLKILSVAISLIVVLIVANIFLKNRYLK